MGADLGEGDLRISEEEEPKVARGYLYPHEPQEEGGGNHGQSAAPAADGTEGRGISKHARRGRGGGGGGGVPKLVHVPLRLYCSEQAVHLEVGHSPPPLEHRQCCEAQSAQKQVLHRRPMRCKSLGWSRRQEESSVFGNV